MLQVLPSEPQRSPSMPSGPPQLLAPEARHKVCGRSNLWRHKACSAKCCIPTAAHVHICARPHVTLARTLWGRGHVTLHSQASRAYGTFSSSGSTHIIIHHCAWRLAVWALVTNQARCTSTADAELGRAPCWLLAAREYNASASVALVQHAHRTLQIDVIHESHGTMKRCCRPRMAVFKARGQMNQAGTHMGVPREMIPVAASLRSAKLHVTQHTHVNN